MPDRLAELVRQRALVEEHLAWLNRQIAEAAAPAPAPSSEFVTPSTRPSPPVSRPPSAINPRAVGTMDSLSTRGDADAILAQYRVAPSSVKDQVRKGCFLYFAAAFLVLGLGVTLLYYVFKMR